MDLLGDWNRGDLLDLGVRKDTIYQGVVFFFFFFFFFVWVGITIYAKD